GVGIGNFSGANGEYPYGTHVITYQVMDQCGNSTACSFTFTVRDGKKPTPYCQYGLTIELMPTTGMVDVWASDFDAGSWDNCLGALTFSFSDDPAFNHLTFTCDSVGMIPIEMWVTDAAGNQDFCETFILVQDNQNVCGFGNPSISGLIATEYDAPVEGVMVELNGDMNSSIATNAYGAYLFTNVPAGGDYTVKPGLDENPLNGVSTYDLVLITAHILNEDPLDSPYQLIAADANNSGSITTSDLVELRRLILHEIPNFTNNTSWRFVDADYVFPEPANPWYEPFPEVFNVNNLDADVMGADFVAVKIGDVNGSAQTSSAFLGSEARKVGTWTIEVPDRTVQPGDEMTVTFEAGRRDIAGFQLTLAFDREALELVDIREGALRKDHLGLSHLHEGAITMSWNGEALPRELLSLTFRATKAGRLSQLLQANSRFTKAEAYDAQGNLLDVAIDFGTTVSGPEFALYQNTPNP
ncbi:MAG: HYR domain-containing protein, partial [Bacteroidetes bacterium]